MEEPRTHGTVSRGQVRGPGDNASVPESSLAVGRFGRMFRNLPSFEPTDTTINDIVARMVDEDTPAGDNPAIPAGFTYLGQFVDHDLTFDPASDLQRFNDPDALTNFRTPRFDLDSVYGAGPADQPYLYERGDRDKLLIGKGENTDQHEDDLPRNAEHVALIGDPRNDENVIVGQLHLAFAKLHNRIVDDIRANGKDGRPDLSRHLWTSGGDVDVFREAQRLTRWHYQWVVLTDFLPKVLGTETTEQILAPSPSGQPTRVRDLELYRPRTSPFVPVEWSVAAYRYGHSQVRPTYALNDVVRQVDIFVEKPTKANALQHLGGGRRLPPFWTLDWRFFFPQQGTPVPDPPVPVPSAHWSGAPAPAPTPEVSTLQPTRLIDRHLARGLSFLPGARGGMRELARLNLRRGRTMGLPSGQAVARRLGVAPLTADDLGFAGEAPLWLYVLAEAEVRHQGVHLGPVGGRIVGEVLAGIVDADPFSFVRTEPGWKPVLPSESGASMADGAPTFTMGDLVRYAVPDDGRRFARAQE